MEPNHEEQYNSQIETLNSPMQIKLINFLGLKSYLMEKLVFRRRPSGYRILADPQFPTIKKLYCLKLLQGSPQKNTSNLQKQQQLSLQEYKPPLNYTVTANILGYRSQLSLESNAFSQINLFCRDPQQQDVSCEIFKQSNGVNMKKHKVKSFQQQEREEYGKVTSYHKTKQFEHSIPIVHLKKKPYKEFIKKQPLQQFFKSHNSATLSSSSYTSTTQIQQLRQNPIQPQHNSKGSPHQSFPKLNHPHQNSHSKYLPSIQSPDHPHDTIIYVHGNSSDLYDGVKYMHRMSQRYNKVDYIIFDYSGYGQSLSKEVGEEIIEKDLEIVLAWVSSMKSLENVILWGFSLGTYPVVKMAAKYTQIKAVILQCPIGSVSAFFDAENIGQKLDDHEKNINNTKGNDKCSNSSNSNNKKSPSPNSPSTPSTKPSPQSPLHFQYKQDYFANINYICQIKCHIFLMHSTHDQIIPFEHAQLLYSKYVEKNGIDKIYFVEVEKLSHNALHKYIVSNKKNQLQKELIAFLEEMRGLNKKRAINQREMKKRNDYYYDEFNKSGEVDLDEDQQQVYGKKSTAVKEPNYQQKRSEEHILFRIRQNIEENPVSAFPSDKNSSPNSHIKSSQSQKLLITNDCEELLTDGDSVIPKSKQSMVKVPDSCFCFGARDSKARSEQNFREF